MKVLSSSKWYTSFTCSFILIFILSITIRLLFIFEWLKSPLSDNTFIVDVSEYLNFAESVINGIPYSDSQYLNPLYGYFLTILTFFGLSTNYTLFIQAIIDTITTCLIFLIAENKFNRHVGLIAGFLYTINVIAVYYSGILLAPVLISFLLTLGYYFQIISIPERKYSYRKLFLSGLAFGSAVLGMPNLILLLLLLLFWNIFINKKKSKSKVFKLFLSQSIGILLILFLSSYLMFYISGRISLFPNTGGVNFYIGNNPYADGTFNNPFGDVSSPQRICEAALNRAERETGHRMSPSQSSKFWFNKGVEYLSSNFIVSFKLYLKKVILLFQGEEVPLNENFNFIKNVIPLTNFLFIRFHVLIALMFVTLALTWKTTYFPKDLIVIIIGYFLSCLPFFISGRHRFPISSFITILGSFGFWQIIQFFLFKKTSKFVLALLVLVVISLSLSLPFKKYLNKKYSMQHHTNIAHSFLKKGLITQAHSLLQNIVKEDPLNSDAWYNLGVTFVEMRDNKNALLSFQNALKINKMDSRSYYNIGVLYTGTNQIENALRYYKAAILYDSKFFEAYKNTGVLLLKINAIDSAIVYLKYADSLCTSKDYKLLLDLGAAYYSKNLFSESLNAYSNAALLNPSDPYIFCRIGYLYYVNSDYDAAIREYETALKLENTNIYALHDIVLAYYKKGDLNKYKEYLHKLDQVDKELSFDLIKQIMDGNL